MNSPSFSKGRNTPNSHTNIRSRNLSRIGLCLVWLQSVLETQEKAPSWPGSPKGPRDIQDLGGSQKPHARKFLFATAAEIIPYLKPILQC